jgi:multicomponent Na+:H+ antiporter subunit C
MSAATVFGLCGAMVAGLGLYGLIANPEPLRKILAFNLLGSGVFLFFGVVARRGAASGFGGDPIPQALVITGIVVAFAATALAIALLLRLFQATGSATLRTAAHSASVDARKRAGGASVDARERAGGASEDARKRADTSETNDPTDA